MQFIHHLLKSKTKAKNDDKLIFFSCENYDLCLILKAIYWTTYYSF